MARRLQSKSIIGRHQTCDKTEGVEIFLPCAAVLCCRFASFKYSHSAWTDRQTMWLKLKSPLTLRSRMLIGSIFSDYRLKLEAAWRVSSEFVDGRRTICCTVISTLTTIPSRSPYDFDHSVGCGTWVNTITPKTIFRPLVHSTVSSKEAKMSRNDKKLLSNCKLLHLQYIDKPIIFQINSYVYM